MSVSDFPIIVHVIVLNVANNCYVNTDGHGVFKLSRINLNIKILSSINRIGHLVNVAKTKSL